MSKSGVVCRAKSLFKRTNIPENTGIAQMSKNVALAQSMYFNAVKVYIVFPKEYKIYVGKYIL